MSVNPTAALGFASTAEDYERSRPSYPPAAIAHLVDVLGLEPGRIVADVAAGTGKLSRLLVASGAHIVAVEPVAEMRAILRREAPSVIAVAGTAEHLPISATDAITVAQAFHWFDGPAALASFHGALRPEAGLAVVYNERETTDGWVATAFERIRTLRSRVPQREDGDWIAAIESTVLFTPVTNAAFDNPHEMSREEALGRFRSLSYVGALAADQQAQVLRDIAAIMDSHPETRGLERVVIPQRTVVWTCRRR